MPITTDPTTPIGLTRLLAADADPAGYAFEDADITAFLDLESAVDGTWYPRFAAAAACEALANDAIRIYGVIDLLDLKTDGAKMSAALLANAKRLRDNENARAEIDYIEWVNDAHSARERIYKQWLRRLG